jgi:ABC-2 type transport system ATP-binding protein
MVIEGSIDKLGREALAGGRYIIEVETAEPSPELVDILNKIKGVIKVEVEDNTLSISTGSDLRSKIAKAVVDSGASLVQMKVHEFSLDDIYMKYFREG